MTSTSSMPLRGELPDHRGGGWPPIAHGQGDGHVRSEGGGELLLHAAAGDDQRRTLGRPDAGVGAGRFRRAKTQDDAVEQQPAQRLPRSVQHALVAEELRQVATHIGDGRGVGRAEVDEEDGAVGHGRMQ